MCARKPDFPLNVRPAKKDVSLHSNSVAINCNPLGWIHDCQTIRKQLTLDDRLPEFELPSNDSVFEDEVVFHEQARGQNSA